MIEAARGSTKLKTGSRRPHKIKKVDPPPPPQNGSSNTQPQTSPETLWLVGITQLRTSTHKLAIETGRSHKPVIPSNNRVFRLCNSGQVEVLEGENIRHIEYSESRKRLLQETGLAKFTGSEEEKLMKIMTPTKEDFEVLEQCIPECFCK